MLKGRARRLPPRLRSSFVIECKVFRIPHVRDEDVSIDFAAEIRSLRSPQRAASRRGDRTASKNQPD